MIKKTVTYEDFDGNKVTEDLYFHLYKKKIIELELSHEGGLGSVFMEMIKSNKMGDIIALFNRVIELSYGKRDPSDPTKFHQDEAETAEFMTSLAYDALFTDLTKDENSAAEFIMGLLPKDMMAQVEAATAADTPPLDQLRMSGQNEEPPPWIAEDRDPTNDELAKMTTDQIRDLMRKRMSGGSTAVPSQPKQVL